MIAQQAAPLPPGLDPLAPQLMLVLPREERRPEDVVEDLVARRRARRPVDAAHDPLAARAARAAAGARAVDVGVLGEVAGSCETLRPDGVTSWRTTRAAASCSASGNRFERALDVLADDGP